MFLVLALSYLFYKILNFCLLKNRTIFDQIAASYHDGSPLPRNLLQQGTMEVLADVGMRSRGHRSLDWSTLRMSAEYEGIWELKIDLREALGNQYFFSWFFYWDR